MKFKRMNTSFVRLRKAALPARPWPRVQDLTITQGEGDTQHKRTNQGIIPRNKTKDVPDWSGLKISDITPAEERIFPPL